MWVKFATWLVMPLTLTLAVMAGLAWRLRRTRAGVVLMLLGWLPLCAMSLPITAAALQRGLEQRMGEPPAAAARADLGVVLGGMLTPPRVPGGRPDLSASIDRAFIAADLVRAGRLRHLLVLGGNQPGDGARQPESEAVRDLMIRWGVPATRITAETGSASTRENARNARAHDIPAGAWLITSGWHMPRALAEFACAGLVLRPYPVELAGALPSGLFAWLPSADALSHASRMLKEWLGLAATRWRCGG